MAGARVRGADDSASRTRGDLGQSARLVGAIAIAPVLVILCARTLGQILGPAVAIWLKPDKLSKNLLSLPVALTLYLALYAAAFRSARLWHVAILVVLAHTASNIVYTIGNYQMLTQFSPREMARASVWTYRGVTLIAGSYGLVMGWIADTFGLLPVLVSCLIPAMRLTDLESRLDVPDRPGGAPTCSDPVLRTRSIERFLDDNGKEFDLGVIELSDDGHVSDLNQEEQVLQRLREVALGRSGKAVDVRKSPGAVVLTFVHGW